MADHPSRPPLTLRMHDADNVAIVANDGGLPAGTALPEGVPGAGLVLREAKNQVRLQKKWSPEAEVVRSVIMGVWFRRTATVASMWGFLIMTHARWR